MKDSALEFLYNFWALLNSIALYILLGILIAGLFKILLPDTVIKKHLGKKRFLSNIKAVVLGIPFRLRSDRIRDFANALKKSGVSKSVTQIYLMIAPALGTDSVLATYGVFGWVFLLYRLISAAIISLLAGLFTALFVNNNDGENTVEANQFSRHSAFVPRKLLEIPVVKAEDKKNLFSQLIALSFDDILKDISRSLVLAVVISALMVTFMPANLSTYIASNQLLNYTLVLLVSIPLYINATASIPLGMALLTVGFSPGAALVFLTAGPATNVQTVRVVLSALGQASLVIYLLSVVLGSLLFGWALDNLFLDYLPPISLINLHEEDPGFLAQFASLILLYLLIKYSFNKEAKLVGGGGCGTGGCGDGGCSTAGKPS